MYIDIKTNNYTKKNECFRPLYLFGYIVHNLFLKIKDKAAIEVGIHDALL